MRHQRTSLLTLSMVLSLFVGKLFAQTTLSPDIVKETFIYAIKGSDTLRMDVMRSNKFGDQTQPPLLFLYGGGFTGGDRAGAGYISYFNRMASEGLTVISIDYSTTLNVSFNVFAMASSLSPAINAAVEDLVTATAYTIENRTALKIDTSLFMISGSSAGAVTVLQADWYLSNRSGTTSLLPTNFKYKGVIAFAGGILYGLSGIQYGTPPAPTLFFHGNADPIVPYGRLSVLFVAFDGSDGLSGRFASNGYPYHFVTVNGGNHDVSWTVMTTEQDRIIAFIQSFVIDKNSFQTEETT